MKRAFIATLILLLTQVGWSSPSNLDRILETGVLVVGTTADYRPFTYREQGELRGYDIDLARLIAAELQVEIEFRPTSWSRLVPDLQEKKFQLAVGGITRTLPRQTRAGFTDPVLTIGKCPLAVSYTHLTLPTILRV